MMNSRTGLVGLLAIVAVLILATSCSNGDAATSAEAATGNTAGQGPTAMSSGLEASGASPAAVLQTSGSDSGIWVTGQASVTVEPDLVLLSIGVETTAETVAQARAEAASAMNAVLQSLKANGIEDQDVQTQSFNIWPQYEYPEVTSGGTRTRTQVLVGYTLSNTARIKIRDVDAVGTIIDDAALAGGDATRINGIVFSVEDPKPFITQLRADAVQDAIAKAEHLADLTGVDVGDLVLIGEMDAGTPVVRSFGFAESDLTFRDNFQVPTSISGGELELSLNVQAVFSIK